MRMTLWEPVGEGHQPMGGRSPNCQLGFAVNRKVDKQERGDL